MDAVAIYTGPTDWRVVAMADLDVDGHADIVWQHPDQSLVFWLMRGGQLVETRTTHRRPQGRIKGIGDFNGDHVPDLIVQDALGRVHALLLSQDLVQFVEVSLFWGETDWIIVGSGDYDGDGLTDLVWQHRAGPVSIWLMDGVDLREARSIYTGPTQWRAIAK